MITTKQQEELRKKLEDFMPGFLTVMTDAMDALAEEISAGMPKGDRAEVRSWAYFEMIDNLVRMRREGTFSFGAGQGDCYEAALRTLTFGPRKFPMPVELVHGTIVDQKGETCRHAWLEIDGKYVLDASNFWDWPLLSVVEKYYEDLQVDPDRQLRYTVEQAVAINLRHGTFGHWEELPN